MNPGENSLLSASEASLENVLSPFLNHIKINKIEKSFEIILIIRNTYYNEYKACKINIKFNCKTISIQNTIHCISHCCKLSICIIIKRKCLKNNN